MASEKYDTCLASAMNGPGIQWDSALDFRVLLLADDAGLTFDATHATVAAVLANAGNNELTDASYTRAVIQEASRSVATGSRAVEAHISSDVDFGALTNETVGMALVYQHVGADDSNNIPLVWWDSIDFPATADGSGFTLGESNFGVFRFQGP